MASQLPDTPGSSPGRAKQWPRERSTFSIDAAEDAEESPHSQQGFDRPDQTVFDLTMDYSDEETLLDWEQYAGTRKFKFWGMDCSLIARFCPFMPCVPQEWYYRFSKRQRKLMTVGFATFIGLLILLVGATVLVVLLPNKDTPASTLGYSIEECSWSSYHLPSSIKPTQYDLELSTELRDPFLVVGAVTVHANVTKPSKCIVLHAVDMNITHMNRVEPHTHGNWSFNSQEQLILEFDEPLSPPMVTFAVHFNYTLKQGLSGFYRSSHKSADGREQVLATTQMEANGARKAFPCFDEPALKAVWNFSMTAPTEQTVLFNMPGQSTIPRGDSMLTRIFSPTPPMSSYLVAFIVGNLTGVSQMVPSQNGIGPDRPVSIWGIPERAQSLKTALEVATTILPQYERLFGVPYALPKLDLVAIPDFAAGAMENWGLITYRETDLLFNANESSLQNERRIALVIAHEMAHLWFGDLVTMKDWGELWLNEGFATYFENVGASIARPNFAYYDTFYSDFATAAMEEDSYPKSTHPLAKLSGMDTTERVEAMFDGISYDKGGSVLRMLRAYLNRLTDPMPLLRRSMLQDSPAVLERETFLKGLQNYLQKHSFNNTSSNDLWAEMDAVTGEDVTGWMKAWTFQPGIPRVQILSDGPANREMHVYQAPFQFSGPKTCNSKGSLESGTAPWWIPLAFTSKDDATVKWQTLSECMLAEPIYTLKDDEDWFKLNAGQYGLFRVNYPNFVWERLAIAAQQSPGGSTPPPISAQDLAGLLDDSWALLQAGETDAKNFLGLVNALGIRGSEEYAPWSVGIDHIVDVHRFLRLRPDQRCADDWAEFVREKVVDPTLKSHPTLALDSPPRKEGAAEPDIQSRLLRPLLAGLSNEFNDTGARVQALSIFQNASALKVDTDIKGIIYAFIASSNHQSSYDSIKTIYIEASDPSEKSRALGALSFAEEESLTQQTLEFALSVDVRSQDTTGLITSVAYRGGPALRKAWDFVRLRYSDIAQKLGGQAEAADDMGKLIRDVASRFADNAQIKEVEALFKEHSEDLTEPRMLEAARENILANLMWMTNNAQPVCDWLATSKR